MFPVGVPWRAPFTEGTQDREMSLVRIACMKKGLVWPACPLAEVLPEEQAAVPMASTAYTIYTLQIAALQRTGTGILCTTERTPSLLFVLPPCRVHTACCRDVVPAELAYTASFLTYIDVPSRTTRRPYS